MARRLLERQPEKAEYRYYMGLGYFGLKNWDASIVELEAAKARSLEGKQLELNQHLGYAYSLLRKFEEAAAAYQLAANQDPQNSDVAITVNQAQPVPNVVGMSQSQATSTIQQAGFAPQVQTQSQLLPGGSGNVTSQSPAGGQTACPGDSVTITVPQTLGGSPSPTPTPSP